MIIILKNTGIADGKIFVLAQRWYASGRTTLYSHDLSTLLLSSTFGPEPDDAPTWNFDESYAQTEIGDMLYSHVFWQPDGYTYWLRDSGRADDITPNRDNLYWVYRRPSSKPMDFNKQEPIS